MGSWRVNHLIKQKNLTHNAMKEKLLKMCSHKREMLCAVLTGLCGMPGGVLQFIPFYHPLHGKLIAVKLFLNKYSI